jgi:mono/diheme cytochrome c family protein
MKRLLLGLLGLVVVIVAAGFAYLEFSLPRHRAAPDITVELMPERIERGRYLAVEVLQCVDCHSERDWTRYGGPPIEPLGAGRKCIDRATQTAGVNVGQEFFPGIICIRNITPHRETGIGDWTDGELIRAIREGVDRDGGWLFPIMPYFIYRNLSDRDVEAVVAYMRSREPVASVRPQKKVDFPLNYIFRLWPQPLDGPVAAPEPTDRIAYGEYLAIVARCRFCHSPRDARSLENFPGREYSGGMPFLLGPRVMYPMNLTPHPDGLGKWTKQDFIDIFRLYGQAREVRPEQNTLMNWSAFARMTDADLGALYDFFMSLEPVPTQREAL